MTPPTLPRPDAPGTAPLDPAPATVAGSDPAAPPRAPVPGNGLTDQLRWAVTAAKAIDKIRRKPATKVSYAKKYAWIREHAAVGNHVPLGEFGTRKKLPDGTVEYVVNPRSFSTNRGAFVYMTAQKILEQWSVVDNLTRTVNSMPFKGNEAELNRVKAERKVAVDLLLQHAQDLMDYPYKGPMHYVIECRIFDHKMQEYKDDMAAYLSTKNDPLLHDPTQKAPAKPAKPLRGDLSKAAKNEELALSKTEKKARQIMAMKIVKSEPRFRELSVKTVPEKWKVFTAVATFFGARPSEIAGAKLSLDPKNPGHILAAFKGAKYDAATKKGLEYRAVSVKDLAGNPSFAALLELVKKGEFVVPMPTQDDGSPLKNPEDSFRGVVYKAGLKFLKKNKSKLVLSPYCFRHGFCADLKAMDVSEVDIAAAMGHASTRTQAIYGRPSGGRKNAVSIKIDASVHKIRHTPTVSPYAKVSTPSPVQPMFNGAQVNEMEDTYERLRKVDVEQELPMPSPYLHPGHGW